METVIDVLKEVFPKSNPYETRGIETGVILRLPSGYYKIYDKDRYYRIQAYEYNKDMPLYQRDIPKEHFKEFFLAIAT